MSSYDVYVSVDGRPLTLWENAVTDTSATYQTVAGHTYGFAAVATNRVGTSGGIPSIPQTVTRAIAPVAPVLPVVPLLKGYSLVAADGGIFSFGDAHFYGSTGGMTLNRPIVGMAATPRQGLLAGGSDGGIFSFGDARFTGRRAGCP